MAGLYRHKVTALSLALEHPETRPEASEALRGLIDAIVLTPNQGELQIELKGNLAAMLGAAQNAKRSPETGDLSLQVVMVTGDRNQQYLQLWPRNVRVSVAADHPPLPTSLFECGPSSISQMSPLKSPSTRMI